MKINKTNIFDFIIYILFFFWFLLDFILNFSLARSFFVQASFLFIGIFSFVAFVVDKRFLSINKIIYIFLFLFMFYTPFHQYLECSSFWGIGTFDDNEYLSANITVVLFMITYAVSYKLLFSGKFKAYDSNLTKNNIKCTFKIDTPSVFVLMLSSVIATIILFYKGELISVGDNAGEGGTLYSVVIKFIRFIPVSSILFLGLGLKYNSFTLIDLKLKIYSGIIVLCFLIIFFPLNGTISRYLLFGTYLSLIALFFEKFKHPSFVLIAFYFGFAVVFPAFNFFKNHDLSEISQFHLGGFDPTFNDYDAHYLLMCTMRYVNKEGVMFGGNLLTALFCFVPRSIWPGKLQASGSIVADYLGATFNNVSCPLFAEFYLSFGYAGVIIFTIIFTAIIKLLELGIKSKKVLIESIYYLILGLMLVTLRGSLLPFASFTVSLILSILFCYCCVKITEHIKIGLKNKSLQ